VKGVKLWNIGLYFSDVIVIGASATEDKSIMENANTTCP